LSGSEIFVYAWLIPRSLIMVEITFSYIHDSEHDERIWAAFMEEFCAEYGVKVHPKRMAWDTAWADLFSYTSLGHSPQVSHVGNTWISSLVRMNALRPFKPEEIADMGEAQDFMVPNWEMGTFPGDKRIWAIPWTGWIHVVCYRKDLLEQAGIDPSRAFGTIEAIKATVECLVDSSLEIPWLNAQLPRSYRDLLHIASSWVWAAGGDFIDKDGTKALFNSPHAIDGLKSWLDIYRAVPVPYKKLSLEETFDLFKAGRAAAVLANIHTANVFMDMQENPAVRDNLGVASVTDVPWTGGGSFVIWDDLRGNPTQEHAAVELVKFLSSKEINLRYRREARGMPSRMSALEETYPLDNPAHDAVMLAAKKGRTYYNMPIWRRIEYQLSEQIGAAVSDATKDPSLDSAGILHAHLDPLAERLSTTLGH
jgi:multiple sugar transport system substrate-binding protein